MTTIPTDDTKDAILIVRGEDELKSECYIYNRYKMRLSVFLIMLTGLTMSNVSAQQFKRITKSGDLVDGARYVLVGRYKSSPDSLLVMTLQDVTGANVKRREGKLMKPTADGSIHVTDRSIAIFELGINGATYSFRDVALDAYLTYSTATTSSGNTALYTMTDKEIESATTAKVKYSKAFNFKSVSNKVHKSSFVTRESTGNVQFALAPSSGDRYFKLFERAGYQDSLYLFREVKSPLVEQNQSGDWTFSGDWAAEELYSMDFASAKRIDFTDMIVPNSGGRMYGGTLPDASVWTYVRKGLAGRLPDGWPNIIEVDDKSVTVQGEAVTDIYGSDRTTLGAKYTFVVPESLSIVWQREISADDGYYTIGLPFDVMNVSWETSDGLPCDVERMIYKTQEEDGVIFERCTTTDTWSKNTPYLWRPKECRAGKVCFSAHGVTIESAHEAETPQSIGAYVNIEERAILETANLYLLDMNGSRFVRAATGSTIAPCRAYLILDNPNEVNLRIVVKDKQTNISSIRSSEQYRTYYTPSGVRLGRLRKGAPLPVQWGKQVIGVSH